MGLARPHFAQYRKIPIVHLNETLNKTDANDADGLAQLAEAGFYKVVRVKTFYNVLTRTLVAARSQLASISKQLSNQIRGLLKTFGLIVPKGEGQGFHANVGELLNENRGLAAVILPLLDACATYANGQASLIISCSQLPDRAGLRSS